MPILGCVGDRRNTALTAEIRSDRFNQLTHPFAQAFRFEYLYAITVHEEPTRKPLVEVPRFEHHIGVRSPIAFGYKPPKAAVPLHVGGMVVFYADAGRYLRQIAMGLLAFVHELT